MALNGLHCADVPLRNCSLTHSCHSIAKELDSGTMVGHYASFMRVFGSIFFL